MACSYNVMVVLNTIDCLSYRQSIRNDGVSWSPRYRVIDPVRVPAGPIIFRTQGMHTAVIIDELVRKAILRDNITGVTLWDVCLSTDEDAPSEMDVPVSAIEQYRTQWKRLPRFGESRN